jgi:GT2 family glycosyltransferase
MQLSILIPTYKREQVLLDTIHSLFKQKTFIKEILVLDQTPKHLDGTEKQLRLWFQEGLINWLHIDKPLIPRVLNIGLLKASSEVVLCLDDDILPSEDLVKRHLEAYEGHGEIWAVVGKIIQPEKKLRYVEGKSYGTWLDFPFDSTERKIVHNVMAGNLSVRRDKAIEIGGFDENFIGVAFRFETEFAERLEAHGGNVLFEPKAVINHLRHKTGGIRSIGAASSKTILPFYAVGAYYYFFRSIKIKSKIRACSKRFIRSVCTRHHLYNPWWIPVTLIAEFIGFLWAIVLFLRGPQLKENSSTTLT